MQKATCQWKKLRGGGLAGFQHKSIYRSQKLRTDMGSMQQVLFRFQLQPFVINWLLSSKANQGTALINGHTHRCTDTPRNTTINRLCHSGSVCVFVCVCIHTNQHRCKTIQMCLINAHLAWEQDLHYFMLCSLDWSQDKMISEGIFYVVIFLFPSHQALQHWLQGYAFVLECVLVWS